MKEAERLLGETQGVVGGIDVINYNTLMKGYLHVGQCEECFGLLDRIEAQEGIAPTQMTYGIALDVCISESNVERTQEVFG